MFPTVLQWAKMQTSFGSLCAPAVLLLGCVLVYRYGYAAKDRLPIFSWANQQILERTLTSPMIPKQSEAARLQRLQRLQTWICLYVMTHLAKCCQESFNYLNSKINCCGCRAKSSTVPPVGFPNPLEDQSLNWNPATGWSSSARFHWAYSILRYSK